MNTNKKSYIKKYQLFVVVLVFTESIPIYSASNLESIGDVVSMVNTAKTEDLGIVEAAIQKYDLGFFHKIKKKCEKRNNCKNRDGSKKFLSSFFGNLMSGFSKFFSFFKRSNKHSNNVDEKIIVCEIQQAINEINNKSDFHTMSLEEFNKMKLLLSILSSEVNYFPITKDYKSGLESISKAFNEYEASGPIENSLDRLCEIFYPKIGKLSPPFDVRLIALFENLFFDSKTQHRINVSIKSGATAAGMRAWLAQNRHCIRQLDEDKREAFYENISLISYLDKRIPNFAQTSESVNTKLEKMMAAQIESRSFAPKFTADEAWLLDHERDIKERFVLHYVTNKNPFLIDPRARAPVTKVLSRYKTITKAEELIDSLVFSKWKMGDVILQSMPKLLDYKGKKKSTHRMQKWFTGQPIYHAGLMIEKDDTTYRHRILHANDVDEEEHKDKTGKSRKIEEVGTSIDLLEFGEEYYSNGYRFKLNKLIKPKFRDLIERRAAALGKNIEHYFNDLVEDNASQYYHQTAENYDPSDDDLGEYFEPKHLIANSQAARYLSVVPSALQRAALTPIARRTSKEEAENALAQNKLKAAEDNKQIKRGLTLRERVKAARNSTLNPSYATDDMDKTYSLKHEICSEFVLKQSIDYLLFVEDLLQKDLKSYSSDHVSQLFDIPDEAKLRFSKLHTGALYELVEKWASPAVGIMEKVGPDPDLFD